MDQQAKRTEPLLKVEHLKKYFPVKNARLLDRTVRQVYAVDDVSFDVYPGETFSLVGESGCGKTTIGKTVLRLHEATDGKVLFDGKDILAMDKEELRKTRAQMQMVFQDPNSSLNPRMTIYESIADILLIHKKNSREETRSRVLELLEMVGLPSWFANRYPHEFSGGQLQRAAIARALALKPKFIVCDEPVSALDVSIQSQVLNLLSDLQKNLNLSYLFISHGLPVVRHISDRVGVMYLGKMIEVADADALFNDYRHPYTKALLSAAPTPDPRLKTKREILQGDVPSPINPPKGCRFCTRCPLAMSVCRERIPELKEVAPGHSVACHLTEQKEA